MCTCPENDIISVYIDNELPQAYVDEYKAHIDSCSVCKERYLKLKQISSVLHQDSTSIQLDNIALEQSFERLKNKMHYSSTVYASRSSSKYKFTWVLPAAAVLAFLMFLPFQLSKQNVSTPIMQPSHPFHFSSGVLSNNVSSVSMPAINQGSQARNHGSGVYQDVGYATNSGQTDAMITVDMFRPNFKEQDFISVKITLTNIGQLPVTTEFSLPINITGDVTVTGFEQ
ncbi:MAG: hypothetical protein J6B81_03045 [Spirochaetaceae bacterium]|nr:hypothetical protein [Spirochaetaceae bacterium]